MLLVLKNSLNHDLRAALFTIAGITAGIIIHTTIALTGLSFLFAESASAYQILRYGGAAYLAYLGSRLLLSLRGWPGTPRLELNATKPSISDRAAFVEGFATNILNPKIIIIISSGMLIFLGAESTLSQRLSYGILLVAEGIIVWIFIALLLQTRQAKNQFLRWQRPINATFGLLLLALAIRTII